jgi:hypothetical protein
MVLDSFIAARAEAVNKAAEHAVSLIQKFAAMDPEDSEHNAWNDPEMILRELDQARSQIDQSWKALEECMNNQQVKADEKVFSEERLRASFIDMITDSFADVLEDMRQKETEIDIEILADCLQSGLELMSQEDKELFLECCDHEEELSERNARQDFITPHEQRRRELGYDVENNET